MCLLGEAAFLADGGEALSEVHAPSPSMSRLVVVVSMVVPPATSRRIKEVLRRPRETAATGVRRRRAVRGAAEVEAPQQGVEATASLGAATHRVDGVR
jgi:hypothetical protein